MTPLEKAKSEREAVINITESLGYVRMGFSHKADGLWVNVFFLSVLNSMFLVLVCFILVALAIAKLQLYTRKKIQKFRN